MVISSLLENVAGVPFTRQWTVRVSRAPKVRISDDAPWVIPEHPLQPQPEAQTNSSKQAGQSTQRTIDDAQLTPSNRSTSDFAGIPHGSPRYTAIPQSTRECEVLSGLVKGYNTVGRVVMDLNEPWSAQSNPFYVIVSIKGVESAHAALRVFSKLLSIGVFTVGTAMFASTTLTTIMIAVVVAALTITAGVFGRVTAMFMASAIMLNKPVIHRVVTNPYEAEQFIEAMLRKPTVVFEILGHVIVDGRCVKRYGSHLRWSKILGVLASPYDLSKLAMPSSSKSRQD